MKSNRALALGISKLHSTQTEEKRRQIIDELFKNVAITQHPDLTRQALMACSEVMGPVDGQIRRCILQMLQSKNHVNVRNVLLEVLPMTLVQPNDIDHALHSLSFILEEPNSSLLPVLQCLSSIRDNEYGRRKTLQLLMRMICTSSNDSFSVIVQLLLELPVSAQEANAVVSSIREKMELCGDENSDVYSDLISRSKSHENGTLVTDAILTHIERINDQNNSDRVLMFDLVVLLLVSKDHAGTTDNAIDVWLSQNSFPMATLLELADRVSTLFDGALLCQISDALVRLAIFLLLSPVRSASGVPLMPAIREFIQKLCAKLPNKEKNKLVHSVLHLSEELYFRTQTDQKHKSEEHMELQRIAQQSLNILLRRIVPLARAAFVKFRHVLIRRLTSPLPTKVQTVRDLCSLLVDLVDSNCISGSDILSVVQKLLFATSIGQSQRPCIAVRGVLLGTALVHCNSLQLKEKNCLREWVLQLLLPSTRRMVDPELGPPGLSFLTTWNECCAREANIFPHVKKLMSNTGIVQMLATYRASTHRDAILGYLTIPKEFQKHQKASQKSRMIFCLCFFLRSCNTEHPGRWYHVTHWVYELTNAYLQLGRSSTSNWRSDGWLNAAFELPSLGSSIGENAFVDEWISPLLNCFDLQQFGCSAGQENSSAAHMTKSTYAALTPSQCEKFQDCLSQLALALLIGISVSSAVLQNAFDHFISPKPVISSPTVKNSDRVVLTYMKMQLMKVYDLRNKSESVDTILKSLASVIATERTLKKRKRATSSDGCDKRNDDRNTVNASQELEKQDPQAVRRSARAIRDDIFCCQHTISMKLLFSFLTDPIDHTDVELFLTLLSTKSKRMDTPTKCSAVVRHLKFSGAILQHLLELLTNSKPSTSDSCILTKTDFVQCMSNCNFLLTILPALRKNHFAFQSKKDEVSNFCFSSLVDLGSSYLRMFTAVLNLSHECKLKGSALIPSFDICLSWLQSGEECHTTTMLSQHALFDLLSEHLRKSDSSKIASAVLELLSAIVFQADIKILKDLTILSRNSLHTVYIHTRPNHEYQSAPHAVAQQVTLVKTKSKSCHERRLSTTLNELVLRILKGNVRSSVAFLRHGMLRHWGIVTSSTEDCLWHITEMKGFVGELTSFLSTFDSKLEKDYNGNVENVRASKTKINQSNPVSVSEISGLDLSTLDDFFDVLVTVVVGLGAQAAAGQNRLCGEDSSPFQHLEEIFTLFRRLVEIYQKYISLFSHKIAASLVKIGKEILAVSICQLQQCVDWRNNQPLLSFEERARGQCDPGSISFLQQLLDTIAMNTVGTILYLCDFWQSREDTSLKRTAGTGLRIATVKTAKQIKEIAASHNLVPLSFEVIRGARTALPVMEAKGFHLSQPSAEGTDFGKAPEALQNKGETLLASNKIDDGSDSDDSFGVSGNWGAASESKEPPLDFRQAF